jgi:ferredoxin-NADP reductase
MASNHVFIAGGIGITAFLALIEVYEDIHWNYELHYAVRSADEVPFKNRLEKFGSKVIIYDKSQRQRMDVQALLGGLKWNSHVYVCGPSRMMEAVRTTAEELGLGEKEIQYEAFAADIGGDPFEVEVLNKGNKVLAVGEDESLLEVLKKEFGDVPSSCEVGNCGTCKVTLKAGKVDHRGTALLTEEKSTTMLSCVSRGIGRIAIEI